MQRPFNGPKNSWMGQWILDGNWGNLDIRSIVFILVRCWASYIAYLVSGNSLSGAKVFGDAFSGIPTLGIFWKIGFGNISFLPIGFLEERSFGIWEALEMLRGAWSEWREFVLVSRALSDEKIVSEGVLAMVRRFDLRKEQCTAPVSVQGRQLSGWLLGEQHPAANRHQRSCNSQSFFPMNCLWRTGMQGSVAYQLFGRRSLWWELIIYARLLAMTFMIWGGSMMSEPCGAILTHNGDSCRAS